MATCIYTYKGKNYTSEELDTFLSKDDRFKSLVPYKSNSETIEGRATSIKNDLRITDKIPLSEQRSIVESLSYMLLSNTQKEGVSNTEDVKNQIKLRYLGLSDLIKSTPEEIKNTDQYKSAVYGSKILEEVIANIDKFVDFAKSEISKLDISESFDEYYEDFEQATNNEEDVFASDNVHYDDGRSRTTDLKEFIPARVKKLMYFLPEYRLLNLNNETDQRIYKNSGEKYTTVNNVIGLPKFNNFSDTWSKTLQLLSQHHFDTNPTGISQMLNIMSSDESPYIVQQLAKKLANADSQTKQAFFVKTNLQLQNSITSFSKFEDGKRVDHIFKSIDIVGTRKVTADLYSEFLATSSLIKFVTDPETGKEIRVIDRDKAIELYGQANKIILSNDSYIQSKNSAGFKTTYLISPKNSPDNTNTPMVQLYNIFKEAGINITYETFEEFVENNWIGKKRSERINASNLVRRILGRMAGVDNVEQLDPFENESSTISKLARIEFKYRPFKQADYYKQGDKSYYPFIKKSYLSDIFAKIREDFNFKKENINKELPSNSFVKRLLKRDVFAKHSRILKTLLGKVYNKIADFERFFTPKYELGFDSDISNKGKKSFSDMIEAEHLLAEYIYFQNNGKKNSYYFFDTLSDKSVQIPMDLPKLNISFNGSIDQGNIQLSDTILGMLGDYAIAEWDRILEVNKENNSLSANEKIKGYHDIGNNEGMGKYFNIYHFLNKPMLQIEASRGSELATNLLEALYPTGKISDDIDNELTNELIRARINQHFQRIFKNSKSKVFENGLVIRNDDGSLNTDGLFDKQYKKKLAKEIGQNDENMLIDNLIVNYTIGYAQKTNELLYFTGDPAQAGKFISKKDIGDIEDAYAEDNPVLSEALILQRSIENSLVNLSKRNASLMASGELAAWDKNDYKVSIAQDIHIKSPLYDEYLKLFPEKKEVLNKAYNEGDGTDAWEVTTVEEYLSKNKAYGIINQEQFLLGLYTYDKGAYDEYIRVHPEYSKKTPKGNLDIFGLKFQPDKPVQRLSVIGPSTNNEEESRVLNMSKQYYIKTSSFPLIPSLVRGTPWEEVLNGMKENNVQRIPFVSGVKQGVSGAKLLFSKNTGEFNKEFFTDNVHTLDRSGFRIQMDVPYHEDKQAIREGSQLSKLLFVDQPDSQDMVYKGTSVKAGELKKLFIDSHREIYEIEKERLLRDLGVENTEGIPVIHDLSKLSKILIDEGLSKDFPINHLQSLDMDKNGDFATPLTFSLSTGTLEPMITAILSNRLARVKLPGYSYVQGSGAYIHNPKGRIAFGEIEEEVKDTRDIIWTKPEYVGTSRLSYIRDNKDGKELSHAQILISPYMSIGGKRVNLKEKDSKGNYIYLTQTESGNLILNRDKIDPDQLEMNGFRIPFQGLNSGMWFEIVGFLPDYVGDLAIVPEEIGAQMGSGYEGDKLHCYMPAYYREKDGAIRTIQDDTEHKNGNNIKKELRNKVRELAKTTNPERNGKVIPNKIFNEAAKELGLTSTDLRLITQEDLDILKHKNNIIAIHKAVFTNPENKISIINPIAFDDVVEAIEEVEKLNPALEGEFEGVYSPNYQRGIYLSNVSGKAGVAISTLANTFHAMAQQSNAYLKGEGIKIAENPNSEVLSDHNNLSENRTNYYNSKLYKYTTISGTRKVSHKDQNHIKGAWRLDKVKTFDGKYTISDLISQILGVSVDNAKEQLLGRFGLNKHNFNTALLMIQAGFNLIQVKKFLSQPILKEYYQILDSMNNIFRADFTTNKRNTYIRRLFAKYGYSNIFDSNSTDTTYVSDMESDIKKGVVNSSNAMRQLKLLNAFINYTNYANDISFISTSLNIDTKGLPKNISDTISKADGISEIFDTSIGNVENVLTNSILGVYADLPELAIDLLASESNPIFAYNSILYNQVREGILEFTGKNSYYKGERDIVHNNIKNFIYTGFFPTDSLTQLRENWLFDSDTNKSLATRHKELLSKYPKNLMLSSLVANVSKFAGDPVRLTVLLSDDKNFAQKMSESWEDSMNSSDTELSEFSKDLARYAISTGNKEFGQSNIIRYIPFEFLEDSGFNDYLKDMNSQVFEAGSIDSKRIILQILQHNPNFVKSTDPKAFEAKSSTYINVAEDKGVLATFELPIDPTSASPEAMRLGEVSAEGIMTYPSVVKVYSKVLKKNLLYTNIGSGLYEYHFISTLGTPTETEYNWGVLQANSMFEDNRVLYKNERKITKRT